jgi:hypothetical protein
MRRKNILLSAALIGATLVTPSSLSPYGGTIVVVGFSKDELVFAADSRAIIGERPDDTACKIVALEPDLIFAAAGTTGQGDPKHPLWSATDEARHAQAMISQTNAGSGQNNLERMASLWANATAQHLKAAIIQDARFVDRNHPELIIGVFGFRGKDANLERAKATLNYDAAASTASEPVIAWNVETGKIDPSMSSRNYEAFGDKAVLEEVSAGQTDRAKKELAVREKILNKASNVLEEFAIRSAEAVVQYSDDGKVGGPIDAVSLDHSGIKWIKRKSGCPAD